MPDDLRIHFIGDVHHFEFTAACSWMSKQSQVTPSATLTSATINRVHNEQPHWIVIGQSRPGEFRHHDIDQLREAAPLATVIALLGGLCDGETRTGEPWAGVVRVYWHQWLERATRQKRRFEQGKPGEWTPFGNVSVVRSNRPNETSNEIPSSVSSGLIIIAARDSAAYETHAALFQKQGFATVWRHPQQPLIAANANMGVWVGAGASESELVEIRQFADELAPTPWVVLLNYPRHHDRNLIMQQGAQAVLGKPICNDDLLEITARLQTEFASDVVPIP